MSQRGRELLLALRAFEKGKLVSSREAVQLIQDGDTLATGGFVGIGFAESRTRKALAVRGRFPSCMPPARVMVRTGDSTIWAIRACSGE